MPEYPETTNYPSTPDQYDAHYEQEDVNGGVVHHYTIRPVPRSAHQYAHGVYKIPSDSPNANGSRVALYATLEQAQYVANALNEWAGSEIG